MGGRTQKDDIRVEAYGTLDELNSFLGEALTRLQGSTFADIAESLTKLQHQLFDAGCDLARVSKEEPEYIIKSSATEGLEQMIDRYEQECEPLRNFILPGGSPAASALHLCRVVSRRAERLIVSLVRESTSPTNAEVRKFMNRVSDLFFVLARTVNARLQVSDVLYRSGLN